MHVHCSNKCRRQCAVIFKAISEVCLSLPHVHALELHTIYKLRSKLCKVESSKLVKHLN